MASPLFGTEEFDEQEKKIIRRLLTQKLGGSHLSVRPGSGGTKFAYIEVRISLHCETQGSY